MNSSELAYEGNSLEETIAQACEDLGIEAGELEYRLDRQHFANGASTVRIFADKSDPANGQIREQLGAFLADEFKSRELDARANVRVANQAVNVLIQAHPGVIPDDPEALATLGEVLRDLAGGALGERTLEVVVRPPPAPEPSYGRDRGDRGDRDRGPRDRDRGPRDRDRGPRDRGGDRGGRDRGPPRGRDRDRGPRDRGPRDRDRPRPERDLKREEELRFQAKEAIEQVLEDGHPVTIEELNSYERRIIHREVSDIAGLTTRSIGRGSHKAVRVMQGEDESREERDERDNRDNDGE